jgi:hypothetical protein
LARFDIAGFAFPLFVVDYRAQGEMAGNAKEVAMPQMDDYGRHEVLHMAQFLSRAVWSELGEHAQVQANPAWKALADTAGQALWDLYQAVGAAHMAGEEVGPKEP